MSKDDFTAELIRRGYNAQNEKGVVMVTGGEKKTFRQIEKIARECGYIGTFGWRGHNAAEVQM